MNHSPLLFTIVNHKTSLNQCLTTSCCGTMSTYRFNHQFNLLTGCEPSTSHQPTIKAKSCFFLVNDCLFAWPEKQPLLNQRFKLQNLWTEVRLGGSWWTIKHWPLGWVPQVWTPEPHPAYGSVRGELLAIFQLRQGTLVGCSHHWSWDMTIEVLATTKLILSPCY